MAVSVKPLISLTAAIMKVMENSERLRWEAMHNLTLGSLTSSMEANTIAEIACNSVRAETVCRGWIKIITKLKAH